MDLKEFEKKLYYSLIYYDMFRIHEEKEMNEIFNRFNNGGVLWFFERTDTNEIYYENCFAMRHTHQYVHPDEDIRWGKTPDLVMLNFAFLTKEDAEKHKPKITVGGCRYCNHGSTDIPIDIVEHEFVKPKQN